MIRATALHELLGAASQRHRIGLICVVLVVSAMGTAWAQGQGQGQGQSKQRVGPSFTIPPIQAHAAPTGSPEMTPDPSETQYAITSVTVTNEGAAPFVVTLAAVAFGTPENNTCRFLHLGFVGTTPGPRVMVAPASTVHITFPEPYVTAPVTGPFVCLGVFAIPLGGPAGLLTWSAVGHKILP